jgi:hypothetical protein
MHSADECCARCFCCDEKCEGCVQGPADARCAGSPPADPHTTVAQRAALGQLVPNSVSSEVSERRAQAFSDTRAVMHPDGDDALNHALEPVETIHYHRPSGDLRNSFDSAHGTLVATQENGTPVEAPSHPETQRAAPQVFAASYSEGTRSDNPYVVIQKSNCPAQPSSARLFYQPPTSLNANMPSSINSNAAGAQSSAAASAPTLTAHSATSLTASHSLSHLPTAPQPQPLANTAVSSVAPDDPSTAIAETAEEDKRLTSTAATSLNPESGIPSSVPPATSAATAATGGTNRTATANTNTNTNSNRPLSTSPPAPETPTSAQMPRISYGSNSLYSQAFGKSQRKTTQPSRARATHTPAVGAALPRPSSVGFTYRKPYSRGVQQAASHASQSVGVGAVPSAFPQQHGHLQAVCLHARPFVSVFHILVLRVCMLRLCSLLGLEGQPIFLVVLLSIVSSYSSFFLHGVIIHIELALVISVHCYMALRQSESLMMTARVVAACFLRASAVPLTPRVASFYPLKRISHQAQASLALQHWHAHITQRCSSTPVASRINGIVVPDSLSPLQQ